LLKKWISLFITISLVLVCILPALAVDDVSFEEQEEIYENIFLGVSSEKDAHISMIQEIEEVDLNLTDYDFDISGYEEMPEFSSFGDVREYVINDILTVSDEEIEADRELERQIFRISTAIYKNDKRTDRYIVKYKADREEDVKSALNGSVLLRDSTEIVSESSFFDLFEESKTEIIILDEKILPSTFAQRMSKTGIENDIEYIQPDYKLSISNTEEEVFELSILEEDENEFTYEEAIEANITEEKQEIKDELSIEEIVLPEDHNELSGGYLETESLELEDLSALDESVVIDETVNDESELTIEEDLDESEEIFLEPIDEEEEVFSDTTIIAVIDTGVDITHEMISPYISDLSYDFINDSEDVYDEDLGNEQSHGTHVVGSIAMMADEYDADIEIMVLKVFENGTAYTSDIIEAIEYAEQNGAVIVNCSFGSGEENPALMEAMECSDLLFVCASGNARADLAVKPVYPAAFDIENVICVASLNGDDGFSYFSNYGNEIVDIAALGRNVEGALVGGGTAQMSGTSMAAAQVSAAAAVLWSELGNNADNYIVRDTLFRSADKLDNLLNKVVDGRRLNIDNALLDEEGEEIYPEYEDDFDVHGYDPTTSELYELYMQAGEVEQISVGLDHMLILKEDGTVWSVGINYSGECGTGDTEIVTELSQVTGLLNVVQVIASDNFSLALKSDGTVWAWGYNELGQLGIGSYTDSAIPVQINSMSFITQIAAGDAHGLALKTNGIVYSWGYNGYGQLGVDDIDIEMDADPSAVMEVSDTVQISALLSNSMALEEDGSVWSWGAGESGQLGTGNYDDCYCAEQVVAVYDIEKIVVGGSFAMALCDDGTVWSWGSNTCGKLGSGSEYDEEPYPVKITTLNSIADISAGYDHAAAVKYSGEVWTWGCNDNGELGNGSYFEESRPIQVNGIYDVEMVICANELSFVKTENGDLFGWGTNESIISGLFDGKPYIRVNPESTVLSNDFVEVASGSTFSIGLKSDGTVWAWGINNFGQLGNGTNIDSSQPVQVMNLANVVDVDAGNLHALALRSDGTVWAWGNNDYGQLGDGSFDEQRSPVQVEALSDVVQVEAGESHSLALISDGTVYAWGRNNHGQLGDGSKTDSEVPIQTDTLTSISYISAGTYHNLAVKSNGRVYAWGENGYGQLGNGSTADKSSPVSVTLLTSVSKVAAGYAHSLALKTDGSVYAWGDNSLGQGGFGSTTKKYLALKLSELSDISQIAVGEYHSMALTSDGLVYVWGTNEWGQLGDSTSVKKTVPTLNAALNQIEYIYSGYNSNFAKNNSDEWISWGYDLHSQLGFGRISKVNVPTRPYLYDMEFNFAQASYNGYIPETGERYVTVSAGGYGRNGEIIPSSLINYSLLSDYAGVSIDAQNGIITIQSIAEEGVLEIAAEHDGEIVTSNLVLLAPEYEVSFSFAQSSYSTYIPITGVAEIMVNVIGTDEYGVNIHPSQITYSFTSQHEGVVINQQTGLITVQASASPGTIGIIATYGGVTANAELVLNQFNFPSSYDAYISINVVENEKITLKVAASNIQSFNGTSYSLYYDSTKIIPSDLCIFTWNKDVELGLVEGSPITIETYAPGEIKFSVSRNIPEGKVWSGILNAIQFDAILSGETTIIFVKNTDNE